MHAYRFSVAFVATFIHNRRGQNCLFFRKEVWLDKLFILSICQIEEKEGHTLKQFARKKKKKTSSILLVTNGRKLAEREKPKLFSHV